MNDKKMTVVIVDPNKEAHIAEIGKSLADMQKAVGGYIEVVYPFDDNAAIVCNDEGKIANLPLNRALKDDDGKIYDIVAGTFFVAGLAEDDFCSLTQEQTNYYLEMFKMPEKFIKINDEIFAVKSNSKTKGGIIYD